MNQVIFDWLYGFAHLSATLDTIIQFFAADFGYVVLLCLGIAVFRSADIKSAFKKAFVALGVGGVSWGIDAVLKYIFLIARPSVVLSNITPLIVEIDPAFPSGHASFFAGVAFSLLYSRFPRAYLFVISAVIIGVARITSGVHWPADVLAGFALGFVVASITNVILRNVFRRHSHEEGN